MVRQSAILEKQGKAAFPHCINVALELLACEDARKEGIIIGKEEIKLFLFVGENIVFIEHPPKNC